MPAVGRPLRLLARCLVVPLAARRADAVRWPSPRWSRPYDVGRGVFGRIEPRRRFGAVQLALRWSRLDLTDAGIEGGEADDLSVGVNWYLSRNLRLRFNYVRVDGRLSGDLRADDPRIFQGRFQLAF